jgi:neutral ceramidase
MQKTNLRLIVCFLTVLFISNLPVRAQTASSVHGKIFRAGASTANITPPLGSPIVGNFDKPLATHIHDELHARALALDDGTTQIAFVVVDNLGPDRVVFDEAKRLVQEKTGLAPAHILMSGTHTHSGVNGSGPGNRKDGVALDEYQTFLAQRIADAVQIALNNLEPARIGWGVGKVPQHVFNRRWRMKEPVMGPFGAEESVVMNPGVENPNLLEPAGPTDPEVSFISLQSLKGRPIGILANYSLHYVGGVPKGHISADYFAVFADRIEELLSADRQDPAFVGILSNGTSGDVNNINFRGPVQRHAPYEKMRIVANDVAQEVFTVYRTLKYNDWVRLQAAHSELTLNVRRPTPDMIAFAKNVLARPDDAKPGHRLEEHYANGTLRMQKDWPEQIDIVLQAFRIGDLGVAAIPFEVFTEIGLEVKKKSPFKPSFTISLANGRYGYLPTPKQHALGGYETWLGTNNVQVDASEKIVNELMRLFSELK